MRSLKFLAYILFYIVIIAITSYVTICMTNTTIYEKIIYNLSTNIGDFLWGTIGIVLTFISTVFLFLTFKFQQSQYKETKDDAFRARFEGTFFNMLSMYYNVRGEADKQICKFSKYESKNMSDFYVRFKDYYHEMLDGNRDFSMAMSELDKNEILETKYNTALYDLGKLYDEYVKVQGCNAGFYFRYVHNLVYFVLKHWKGKKDDIHTYLNFIQAEMSDEELGLLFYNSISNMGQDKNHQYRFKHYLDDNSFLENISEETLLCRAHYRLFPKTNFSFLNDDERKQVIN